MRALTPRFWRVGVSTLVAASLALGGLVVSTGTAAAAAPKPAAAAAAADLGYNYTYSTGMRWPQTALQTPSSVMTEVATNFWAYFPFSSNCTSLPQVGGVCDLYSAGLSNPVQVVARTSTSFTFVALPGHAEGAGRYIQFTFYKTGIDPLGDIRLRAQAWGPWTAAAQLTISSGLAFSLWSSFAANVGAAYN